MISDTIINSHEMIENVDSLPNLNKLLVCLSLEYSRWVYGVRALLNHQIAHFAEQSCDKFN